MRAQNVTGKLAEEALGHANITCNKNGIPFDPESPMVTSGIRLGSPAATTRGFGKDEFIQIADMISKVVMAPTDSNLKEQVKQEVIALCHRFPIYTHLKGT